MCNLFSFIFIIIGCAVSFALSEKLSFISGFLMAFALWIHFNESAATIAAGKKFLSTFKIGCNGKRATDGGDDNG